MKYYLIFIFSTLVFFSCSNIKKVVNGTSCSNKLNIQYDNTFSRGVMAKKEKKKITVFFLNYFHDSIKVYFNRDLKFHDFVLTNTTTGKSNKSFSYDYSKVRTVPIMKVESENHNCFEVPIKKNYKIVYLFIDDLKKWTIRYSNRYYVND